MIPLGLTATEQAAFHRVLKGLDDATIDIDVRVHLLDMEEKFLVDLSSWLAGGEVKVSAEAAEVTRSCQLTLVDPDGRAGIESDRPGVGAHLNRMITVSYGVWVPAIGDEGEWVRVPVFRGPIAKSSRDGDILEIEALGKEHLLMSDAGWSHNYGAGLTRTGVVRDILRRSGERRYSIPSWKPKTGKKSVMPKIGTPLAPLKKGKKRLWNDTERFSRSHPWSWITAIARSMRAQVWFDGSGTCRMRLRPTRASWSFTPSHLLSEPVVTVDDEEVFNHVLVIGAPPEGQKGVVEAYGSVPASHPNSVQNLSRNGVYRYLTDTIEDSEINTVHDARVARDRRLNELVVETYSVEFDCLAIPHLDPGDMAHLSWDTAPGSFRLSAFTIPLGPGESMQVSYSRNTLRTPAMTKAARMRRMNRAKESKAAAARKSKSLAQRKAAKATQEALKEKKKRKGK